MMKVRRSKFSWLMWGAFVSLGILILVAPESWAQYYGGNRFPPANNPFAPDPSALYGQRIAALVLTAAIGFAIGAFFSPKLRPFRKIALLVLGVAIVAFSVFGPAPFADIVNGLAAFVLGIVAFLYGIKLGRQALQAARRRRPTSFGSAKWADLAHLLQNKIVGKSGYMLGEFHEAGQTVPLTYDGARHLLTVAPTRSGKGVSSIIPNLLTYPGSAFVIDPKGENALVTAYRRGAGSNKHTISGMGQQVHLIDPWDIAASSLGMTPARFNPLDWIKIDDPDVSENAFLLAEALVPDRPGGGDSRFWDDEAKALLSGLILYVATAPAEHGKRHLGRVRELLVQTSDEFRDTLMAMFKHPNPVVSSTAARTASKEDKLLSSVLASAQAHTHFLDSPRIQKSLEASDVRFDALKTEPTTVYLILPADRLQTFDRWMRLLVQQAITINARNIEKKPAKPILFLLDEMAAIGRLASVEQAYGLMAGFGMQLWGIVQDLSQLARIYGQTGWQTFISNSGVIQYFGSRDKMTAEYFSSLCGVTTVEIESVSSAFSRVFGSSSGPGGGSSSNSTSETTTTGRNESQRQLAYPDELMVLKGHQQIIFVENLDPIGAEKVIWYSDASLRAHGVNLQAALAPTPPQPKPAPQTVAKQQTVTPTPTPQAIERPPAPSPKPAQPVVSQPAPTPAPIFTSTPIIPKFSSGPLSPGYTQPAKREESKAPIAPPTDGKTIVLKNPTTPAIFFGIPPQKKN